MGVGVGFGPNGQIVPVVTFDPPAYEPPEEYDYRFETSDGVEITVNVQTDNPARAETVRLECVEKLGWTSKPLEDEEEVREPMGPVGIFFESMFWTFLAGALIGTCIAIGFLFADAFGAIDMDDWRVGYIAFRGGIIGGVVFGIWNAIHETKRNASLLEEQQPANAGIER